MFWSLCLLGTLSQAIQIAFSGCKIGLLLLRTGWADFYRAYQRSFRHLEQIDYKFGNVFRLDLPVIAAARSELGGDAARHDAAYAHAIVSVVQHHRFAEAVEAELGGVVGSATGERILTGQAADVNYVSRARFSKLRKCFAAAVENSG